MLSKVSTVIVNFLRWWVSELKGIFSPPRRLGSNRYPRRLVLSSEDRRFAVLDENLRKAANRASRIHECKTLESAAAALAGAAKSKPHVPIGVRFSPVDFLIRRIDLPSAARSDIAKVLDLELERTTPFRHSDIYTAHFIDEEDTGENGNLAVHQVIVKRETVDRAVECLADEGLSAHFADCWNHEKTAALPIDLLAPSQTGHSASTGGDTRVATLAVLSIALAAIAIGVLFARYENALNEVSAATTIARNEAGKIRQIVSHSQALSAQTETLKRLHRNRVHSVKILEELSVIIPDTVWLSDMRLDAGAIELTGYADSAAPLIPLLENSALFDQAVLTAPVMLDTRRDKERFSLKVQLKNSPTHRANETLDKMEAAQ